MISILLCEGIAPFILVSLFAGVVGSILFGPSAFVWALALLLGAIASATDPATTTSVLKEYKTRGPVTATILGIVALDDGLALLLFAFASTVAHYVISVLLLFIGFYVIGWFTTRLIGRQFLRILNEFAQKIPFLGKIYWGTKQVIEAFQAKPGKSQQVVLIDYPHPGMKTIGLVTKSLKDITTGSRLYAVYVPTTPNPTSGFLEIVPVENVVHVEWSVNDAIAFIVSGGSVGPEDIAFTTTVIDKTEPLIDDD